MEKQNFKQNQQKQLQNDNDIHAQSIYSQHSQTSRITPKDFSKQKFKYSIISQQANNQIIQLVLMPTQSVYYQGQIIYSNQENTQIYKKYFFNQIKNRFLSIIGQKSFHLQKLSNQGIDLNYYGIKSHQGGGKILVLDSQIYDKYFYIKNGRVLISNLGRENSQFKKHDKLKHFLRGKPNQLNKDIDSFFIAQSEINSTIIEKSLGQGQRFVCKLSNILAFSNNVRVKNNNKSEWVTFQGPGWVFIQTGVQKSYQKYEYKTRLNQFLIIYFFIIIGITIFEKLLQGMIEIE